MNALIGGVAGLAALAGLGWVVSAQSGGAGNTAASKEWPTYGHDPGGMRFSPLTQITPANVGQLEVAWVYHMKPAAAPPPAAARRRRRRRRRGAASATRRRPPRRPRSRTRRLGLPLERGHAARRQRR